MIALIADDHALVRRGLREVIEEASLGLLVEESGSASDTLKAVQENYYEIILLDISFPDGNGLDILQQVQLINPQARVLLLSMHPEEHYARRAMRLGASGYLTKNSAPDELITAIQKILAGGRYISRELAENIACEIGERDDKAPHEMLSDREFQVLIHLGAGHPIHAIAKAFNLSPKTISTYRTRLLEKMNLKSDADIVRYVIVHHLVD